MKKTLTEIGRETGTDKATRHGYTEIYERYLSPLRDQDVNVLELGWGGHEDPDKGGESARMWREYFPHAEIVIVDNKRKNPDTVPAGIHLHHGDQAGYKTAHQLAARYGQFDVIVDDASHLSSLTISSFKLWWPYLKPGGIYAVEDTHSSYHSHYYGHDEANPDPDSSPRGGESAMQFLRRLADEVNFKGRDGDEFDLYPRRYWRGYDVQSVHFYFDLCVIIKGL